MNDIDALAEKVDRINELRSLLTRSSILWAGGATAKYDGGVRGTLDTEVKNFLANLLRKELGIEIESEQVVGLNLTPEKVEALNTLLDKLIAKKSAPEAAPTPMPPARRPSPPSMVLQALHEQAGGAAAWQALPPEQRAEMMKEFQAASKAAEAKAAATVAARERSGR